MSQSGRSGIKRRSPCMISAQGLSGNGLMTPCAIAGGTRGIRKLANVPIVAMPTKTKPIRTKCVCHTVNRRLPIVVPKMMAKNVVISITPLTRDSAVIGTISGMMPYFAGLKSADCSDIRNSTVSMSTMLPVHNARHPKAMAPISKNLVPMRTWRLLCTSARCPA